VNKFQKQNNNKDIHQQQQTKRELKSLKKYPQNINYRNKSLIFLKVIEPLIRFMTIKNEQGFYEIPTCCRIER